MRLTGLLPRRVMDALLSVAGTPVLFSNIPGPRLPPRLFGCDVVQMGGWIPLIKSYGTWRGVVYPKYTGIWG